MKDAELDTMKDAELRSLQTQLEAAKREAASEQARLRADLLACQRRREPPAIDPDEDYRRANRIVLASSVDDLLIARNKVQHSLSSHSRAIPLQRPISGADSDEGQQPLPVESRGRSVVGLVQAALQKAQEDARAAQLELEQEKRRAAKQHAELQLRIEELTRRPPHHQEGPHLAHISSVPPLSPRRLESDRLEELTRRPLHHQQDGGQQHVGVTSLSPRPQQRQQQDGSQQAPAPSPRSPRRFFQPHQQEAAAIASLSPSTADASDDVDDFVISPRVVVSLKMRIAELVEECETKVL